MFGWPGLMKVVYLLINFILSVVFSYVCGYVVLLILFDLLWQRLHENKKCFQLL